ncbi:MAG: Transcriptional regulator, TrmB [Candidatus Taylorbacteria bacterium]|nr:Transcriptional regulator, TrmB [Candidatus Taylorbacteria bacterium]
MKDNFKDNGILISLENIGLSHNEAAVYLACLGIAQPTVLQISNSSGVKRASVYAVLNSLIQKGLVFVKIAGMKKFYKAEHPEKLTKMFDLERELFSKKLPQLVEMYTHYGDEQVISHHQGLTAVKHVYADILSMLKPGDYYYVISNIKGWQGLDEEFFMGHVEERSHMGIDTKLLFQDSDVTQRRIRMQQLYNEKIRVLPKETVLDIDIAITPYRIVMLQLSGKVSAIVMSNQSIISAQKQMFEIMWNDRKDVQA